MIKITGEKDRELLKKIVAQPLKETCIATILIEHTLKDDRAILLHRQKRELQLVMEKDDDEKDFADDLLNFISLIEYLRNNNLVFTHIDPNIQYDPTIKTNINKNETTALSKIQEIEKKLSENQNQFHFTFLNTIYDYIDEYIGSYIYIRPELKDYVNNDFNSIEDRRFKKTLFWTRFAATISFVGLLFAIILPIMLETKIESNQFKTIKDIILQQEKERIFKIEKIDTLNVSTTRINLKNVK